MINPQLRKNLRVLKQSKSSCICPGKKIIHAKFYNGEIKLSLAGRGANYDNFAEKLKLNSPIWDILEVFKVNIYFLSLFASMYFADQNQRKPEQCYLTYNHVHNILTIFDG